MNFNKKINRFFVSTLLISSIALTPVGKSSAAEPTVSVKLQNYIGNKTSLAINTQGQFRIQSNDSLRLDGANRFVVASKIAANSWGNGAETIILANYNAFADALSAAPLAYKYKGPILLTQKDFLTGEAKKDIQTIMPSQVIIVGGTGSVSDNVVKDIKNINSNISVRRIGGADRFEVSQKISSELGTPGTSIVANGMNFPDALAIAPYASRKGYPILLTQPNKLPSKTAEALKANKTTKTIVVGGEASVGPTVYSKLPGADRIGGADRFEVAANILKELNMSSHRAFVATGLTFADALTGSVYAAKQNAPLLLTMPNSVPSATKNIIDSKAISEFTVLGGSASVSDTVMTNLPAVLTPDQDYTVKKDGSELWLYKGSTKIKDFNASTFTLGPDKYSTSSEIRIDNNLSYLGDIKFALEGGYIRPTNENIPLEDYLKGVLPAEMSYSWEKEALKAQAVAARSFVFRKGNMAIDDSQANQVYKGYIWGPSWYATSNQAVAETKGLILTHPSEVSSANPNGVAQAFYYSSNGGKVLTNKNSWGSARLPYSVLTDDPYDLRSQSTLKNWSFSITKKQIDSKTLNTLDHTKTAELDNWWNNAKEADSFMANFKNYLKSYKYIASTSDIRIADVQDVNFTTSFNADQLINGSITFTYYEKTANGYVMETNKEGKTVLKTNTKTVERRAYDIRSMIGTSIMPSPYIKSYAENTDKTAFVINGGGFGHGIGMSQYGAKQMAREKLPYTEILKFYYPGTTPKKLY
ncbi:cell wall-binding repeat-containing protein [Fictibacillus nanhaiensis]|uniref:cell wall-binding repeat-containing protein n=1 Tax=Fictibacillus nanhaiensis TaxID=742169 RepID=UPI001C976BA0|nr:cell wall-binding repeat-containing protein [Fictibacillus nanhaiensis]MBY6037080.1 cell wall-binding repeat-containing protein [Fictibacillus nanhaiensis]